MKRKLLILAVVVGMMGALLATAGIAVGTNGDPFYADRGVLLLDTGGDEFRVDWYEYASPGVLSTTPTATQALNVDRKCNVTLSGDALISLSPTGGNGKVGAVSHGLGVKDKNNCSTSQGQIQESQTLTLALGTFFDETFFIRSAELDVEGKRNAKLGVEYGETTESIVLNNTSSDNGPDSGTGDNNIAEFGSESPPFRSVRFYPVPTGSNSPAVAIEGGGDGEVSGGVLRTSLLKNQSLLELVQVFDGELDCGDVTPTEGGGNDAAISVRRGGQENCVLKPYNDDAFGSTASFEPVGQPNAEFTALITWPAETAVLPVPVTQIDFDGDGPLLAVDVQWCTGTAERNPDGTLSMRPGPEAGDDGFIDYAFINPPELPSGAAWCLLDQDVSYINGGEMQVTEYYYGRGDPRWSR
jgi:hypothetical protein